MAKTLLMSNDEREDKRMAGDAIVSQPEAFPDVSEAAATDTSSPVIGRDPLNSKYSEMSDEYKANNAKADHKQARKDAGTYTNDRLESYKIDNINDFDPTKTGIGYKEGENRLNVTELNKLSDQFGQQAVYDFATSGPGSDAARGKKAQSLLDSFNSRLTPPAPEAKEEEEPVNNAPAPIQPSKGTTPPPNPNVPQQNVGGGAEALQALNYDDPGYSQNFASRYGAINDQLQKDVPNFGAANVSKRQELGIGADLAALDTRIQQRPLYSGARSELAKADLYGDKYKYKPPTWESGLGTAKTPDDPDLEGMYEGIIEDIKDVY